MTNISSPLLVFELFSFDNTKNNGEIEVSFANKPLCNIEIDKNSGYIITLLCETNGTWPLKWHFKTLQRALLFIDVFFEITESPYDYFPDITRDDILYNQNDDYPYN